MKNPSDVLKQNYSSVYQLDLPCPLCGSGPMQLRGDKYGEQYYRCAHSICFGSRDVEGSSFGEETRPGDTRRTFVRTGRDGTRSRIYRIETAPTERLEAIPGQPGLFRTKNDPNRVISARDFFQDEHSLPRLKRGRWDSDDWSIGIADPNDPKGRASELEALFISSLASEPQRTVARMFAIIDGRLLPRRNVDVKRDEVNNPAPAPSETPEMETKKMTDEAPKKMTQKILDQGKDIGSAMLDGLAEATVEEAGDILIDMAKELFEGEAMLTIFLASPDGRELVKGLMALLIDSAAVHTNIPKASALRKLARYQFRSSARRVGGPRIKKVMKRFSKLIELSERLPELLDGQDNVVDFGTAKEKVAR